MWALKERGKTGEKHEKGGKMGGWIAGRLAQGAFLWRQENGRRKQDYGNGS